MMGISGLCIVCYARSEVLTITTLTVINDVYEYEVKNQATEETHDLMWKTPPM